MLPKTIQGKIIFVSLCVNVIAVVISVVIFLRCRNTERVVEAASYTEAAAQLHGGMVSLQNFKNNQQKPPEEFVRELKETEAIIFLERVNGLAWVMEQDERDEIFVRLKKKLQVAREFITANPDLFSTNSVTIH